MAMISSGNQSNRYFHNRTTRRGGPARRRRPPSGESRQPSRVSPRAAILSRIGKRFQETTAMTSTTSMTELKVRDLMTPEVVSVQPEDSVAAAYELMLDHRFRHLVVLDKDGDLVGLLTHRDLLRHSLIERAELPLPRQHTFMQRTRVEEVMTSEVESTEAGQPLATAAQAMFENKYGCLPVVEGSRVVGILTEADFVRFFALAGRQAASWTTAFGRAS